MDNEHIRTKELSEELKKVINTQEETIVSLQKEIDELRNERDFFKTLMDQIPDTIYFKDLESRFTRINRAQANTLGLCDPKDAIGKTDFDFFLEDHAKSAYEAEKEIIKSKKPLIAQEVRLRNSKGEFRWVKDTKVPILDKNNIVVGTVGISHDVTEDKEAEDKVLEYTKELQYLNASKDKFFSIIAHDLKNPFSSLLGSTEILITQKDYLTEEETNSLINNIFNSCKHTYHLLDNLLQWSRSQTGRIDYCPTIFAINIAIKESFTLLENLAIKKGVTIKINLNENLDVYADANMIETVLRNLITNAIKFSNSGKEIVVSAKEDVNGKVIVSVTDNGLGISDNDILKLFKIDVTHSTPGTCHEMGTGLGLILCKEFVEKNGGKIWVTSQIGKGSTFFFSLPTKPKKSKSKSTLLNN